MTEHTPGEWMVDGDYIMCDPWIIARISRHAEGKLEDEANLRLIAAAPRLLAACQAVELAEARSDVDDLDSAMAEVRAAIAAATGSQDD